MSLTHAIVVEAVVGNFVGIPIEILGEGGDIEPETEVVDHVEDPFAEDVEFVPHPRGLDQLQVPGATVLTGVEWGRGVLFRRHEAGSPFGWCARRKRKTAKNILDARNGL